MEPNGRLLTFGDPNPLRRHYMGVDIGSGQGLTNSVIHVLQEGNMHSPDIQVAEFACDFLNPHEFAAVVNLVGNMYYSDIDDLPAMACIENNNQGESCQYDLMTYYGYTNVYVRKILDSTTGLETSKYGWMTTPKTRPRIVNHGYHQIKRKQWKINSPWFIDEMGNFTTKRMLTTDDMDLEKQAVAAGRHKVGAKDDRLMAGFIAIWCCHENRVLEEDPAISRAREEEIQRIAKEEQDRTGIRKDFQNTAISYDRMMSDYY